MFNFTTTTVINSNYDLATGLSKWSLTQDKNNKTEFGVKGVMNFKDANCVHVYKAAGYRGTKEEIEFDFTNLPNTIKEDDTLRLNLVVALSTDKNNSTFANDYLFQGKSFTVEFPVKDTITNTVKNLAKIVNKYALMVYGSALFKVTANGNKLVVTAIDEFERFPLDLAKVECLVNGINAPYTVTFVPVKEIAVTKTTEGKVPFADYSWLLRNVRIPTCRNNDAFAVNGDQLPVPGALYNQYTIEYLSNPRQMGLNAIGEESQSKTTHVFFVRQDLIGNPVDTTDGFDPNGNFTTETDFELALKKLVENNNAAGEARFITV